MKHRPTIARVIVCLLLGTLVNFTVALCLAGRYSIGVNVAWGGCVLHDQAPLPYVFVDSMVGATDIEAGHSVYAGNQRDVPTLPYWSQVGSLKAPHSPTNVTMIEFSRGWPCESLYGRRIEQSGMPMRFEGAWPLVDEYKAMPLIPIWPGFAVNTLFYAVLVLPLTYIPILRTVREILKADRVRRGLCPACAYPIGQSPVCTECGKPLAKHKAQTQKAQMS